MIHTLILCTALLASSLFAERQLTNEQEGCGNSPGHMRVSARYTTPEGIGYKTGYTTIEGFFAPQTFLGGSWLPFLDLRGHAFDNGKLAAK